jgi:hypothetical protein
MPIHDRYFPGSTVSRYLPPGDRSWAGVIYQSGRPPLDSEFQLEQDLADEVRSRFAQRTTPSGWVRGQTRYDSFQDFSFPVPTDGDFVADAFRMRACLATVAGHPVWVEYTNTATAGQNVIQLDTAPVLGGAPPDVKRSDFVFLEVWLALVSFSPHASGTVLVDPALPAPGDTVVINGLPLTAVAGAPAVDQFQIGADEFTTAANIAAAINDPANSFDSLVTASSGATDTVTIRAVVAGAAGNAITLSTTGTALTASAATLTGGVDTTGKPTQSTVYRHGNTQADASVNLADDLADPVIDVETTKRVQVQYRFRATGAAEAVNFQTQADGFSNLNVLAQGGQAAPVASYPFVRADNASTSGSSDASAYGYEDGGLWVAGDGSSGAATDLNTVDGFVYAIPVGFVFRRNDASGGIGFDPIANTNGALPSTHGGFVNPAVGVIAAGKSDRPDGAFSDAVNADDLLDLRRHVSMTGWDLAAELEYQMSSLLDGQNRTWAIDAADKNTLGAGSGDVSTRFLVCNQVGRSAAKGGVAPTSGSTTRGDTIRDFDHFARRFGSAPVVERVVLALYPTDTNVADPGKYVTQANLGYAGWAEGDEIHLDLSALNATTLGDFDPASTSFTGTGAYPNNASVFAFVPPGTTVTNVLSIRHDDGNYAAAVSQDVQAALVEGIGTAHVVITLDANDDLVNGGLPVATHRMVGDGGADDGSGRRIFVELEVTYPFGAGLTDTPGTELEPDPTSYVFGPMLENSSAQRPDDFETVLPPAFRSGYREVKLEYVANLPGSGIGSGTPITDTIVSRNTTELVFPRRVFGSSMLVVGVTDQAVAQAHNVDDGSTEFGSSSRLVVLDTSGGPMGSPLSGAGQTLCAVTYFAQDPVPNYGALGGGYQVGVYYRTPVKPTVGVKAGALSALPDPLVVEPLVMSRGVWTGQTGKGSADLPFPYESPLDYVAVNDGGTSSFTGEWYFAATAEVSVGDFDAQTGLLNLHAFVPVDGSGQMTFQGKTKDVEFRAFYDHTDVEAYRPTIMGQPLSSVARHKVFAPFLVRSTADSALFRKNEVLLVVVSRFAELDADNSVVFTDTDNRSAVAVYRTRNMLILVGE